MSARRSLDEVLRADAIPVVGVDELEQIVIEIGRATRDRPAQVLMGDLSAHLVPLRVALQRSHSASGTRQLTRVAAKMSGLVRLTLCELDERTAFRTWAKTARTAARRAGNPLTHSWVLAQEAYGHYYSGHLDTAVGVARHAQDIAVATPCVGSALGAALEGRAYAAMGRRQETRAALGRAEDVLCHLDGDELASSAFGYNEAQFRFHEGNAFTHLRDARAALPAQERALELCAPGDYTDWALTRLDRSNLIIRTSGLTDGLSYAAETLTMLSESQRRGIITLRGHQILGGLPAAQQKSTAARQLRELLMTTTDSRQGK